MYWFTPKDYLVKEIDGISDPEIKYQAQRELAFSADNG
jgi:hypothetical protein